MIDHSEGRDESSETPPYWKRHYGIGDGALNPKARPGCRLSLVAVTATIVLLLIIRLVVAIVCVAELPIARASIVGASIVCVGGF